MSRQQQEREAWTRHIEGASAARPAGYCSECPSAIPPDRLAKKYKTCSVECGKAAQSSKYGGRRVTFNGREYPSQREANIAAQLQTLERARKIFDLKEQVRIVLIEGQPGIPSVAYIADFTYYDQDGTYHVQDAKGMKTAVYLLKKRIAFLLLKITIEEV